MSGPNVEQTAEPGAAPNFEEVFGEETRAALLLAMERVTEREDNPPPGRLAYAALVVLAPHVAALVAAAEERGAAKERERLTEEVAMVETWRAAVVGMTRRLHEIEEEREPADAAAEYLDALERSTDSPRLKAAIESVRRGAS